jgi:hypothetical protein
MYYKGFTFTDVVTRATYDKMVQSMSTELGRRAATASESVKQMFVACLARHRGQ